MISMNLVSLMTCLMGIGLYVFDLITDVTFSFDMLYGNIEKQNYYRNFKYSSIFDDAANFSKACCKACWEEEEGALVNFNPSNTLLEVFKEDYQLTGWFAVWHCIQPFVVILIVFLSMNYKKLFRWDNIMNYNRWFMGDKFYTPGKSLGYCASKTWWPFNAVCCCLPNVIMIIYIIICTIIQITYIINYIIYICIFLPIPVFTNLHRFFLDVKFHNARSKFDFKTRINDIEETIKEHENLGRF